MMEDKKKVFEHWLQEYGSHLEQIAGSRLSDPEQKELSRELRDPACDRQDEAK